MATYKKSIIRTIKQKVFNNPPMNIYLTLQDVYEVKEIVEEDYFQICTDNNADSWYDPEESTFVDSNDRCWTINGPFEIMSKNKPCVGYSIGSDKMLHFSDDLLDLHTSIEWLSIQHDGFVLDEYTTNYTLILDPSIHSYRD